MPSKKPLRRTHNARLLRQFVSQCAVAELHMDVFYPVDLFWHYLALRLSEKVGPARLRAFADIIAKNNEY